jgi:hypothetical protein
MSEIVAVQIVGIFLIVFLGIIITVMWFTHQNTKLEQSKEIKVKKMEIIDRHFNEMVRIECPYCKSIYKMSESSCPGCGANTRNILFPDLPE